MYCGVIPPALSQGMVALYQRKHREIEREEQSPQRYLKEISRVAGSNSLKPPEKSNDSFEKLEGENQLKFGWML